MRHKDGLARAGSMGQQMRPGLQKSAGRASHESILLGRTLPDHYHLQTWQLL